MCASRVNGFVFGVIVSHLGVAVCMFACVSCAGRSGVGNGVTAVVAAQASAERDRGRVVFSNPLVRLRRAGFVVSKCSAVQ